jgi:1,2-dihydroxy-3-keto-5-methylthiopentene dioxygenase
VPSAATAGVSQIAESHHVERFRRDHGFLAVEVAEMEPLDDPAGRAEAAEARARLLREHTHTEDEAWLFVEGRSCFFLHRAHEVCALVCERGDLVTVPAGTRHWFDMGDPPDFRAVRFYKTQPGFVATFTEDPISSRFMTMSELLAQPPKEMLGVEEQLPSTGGQHA